MDKFIRKILKNYKAEPYGVKRRAAVLIPLIEIDQEWHIIYQVRSSFVSQPGETSFPGGGIEAGESPREAAVRETMEELNLLEENIQVLGEIDYLIRDSRQIYCFVGLIQGIAYEDICPNHEVDHLFTLSLDYLMKNSPSFYELSLTHDADQADFPYHLVPQGKDYPFEAIRSQYIPFYELESESLWGFTANITDRFIKIIKENQEE